MIKHLTTHGNSLALIIEKAILELLHITQDTPLDIQTDGRNLIISPVVGKAGEKRFEAAMSKVRQRHDATFKALTRKKKI
jgi:antitoxin component of MazEF toxin-antitoxin module